ncbi:glycosyltransferase family 4 protein [Halomonas rhizosphaerae]|uniref:Glycosyltransferase family 4 protein n=1 Tax=Halomonas rhizosphaerae TaxID=3043296 RepID=A0ABT6V0W7_9GAMM|nr:glycosyltransferase family 4 protein [Halomonas rhizosphaerae]MDI5891882.1 glycosyltransferase family 4 protein [Halomonas rhizosphaerae]
MMKKNSGLPVVVTAITSQGSATLVRGQLNYLKDNGFDPVLLSSPGESVRKLASSEGIRLYEIPMVRDPSPLKDIVSLVRIIFLFIRIRPDIVNAGTPKAGFLCMVASYVCRVRGRIYTIRGFRHESLSGIPCAIMKRVEKISCFLATQVVCISASVGEKGLEDGILQPGQYKLNGIGSSNGINLNRFDPCRTDLTPVNDLKKQFGVKADDFVIGFVGRLIDRKGVDELVEAFSGIKVSHPRAKLLLIGPTERQQCVSELTMQRIESDEDIISLGFVKDIENYYRMMDLLVLPAHWEGFGNVLIEAAAMGVPTVTCDVTGTKDAVSDGFNGTLVPVKNVGALASAITDYIVDDDLRKMHGKNGTVWAKKFSNVVVWSGLVNLYRSMLIYDTQ